MTENTKKIFKFKDFCDFEVVEYKSKAKYIQILSTKGENSVIRIDGSIGDTYACIFEYYYRLEEILNACFLILSIK